MDKNQVEKKYVIAFFVALDTGVVSIVCTPTCSLSLSFSVLSLTALLHSFVIFFYCDYPR